MILKRLRVHTKQKNLLTNAYIVLDEDSQEVMVIDPGGEPELIAEALTQMGIDSIKYIFLTHCHADHIGGVHELKNLKGGKVLVSRPDSEGLYNKDINMCDYIGLEMPPLEADSRLDDGDVLHLGKMQFKVIATPGHTKGGLSLYCEKERLVFTGDTLFSGTWGRTDLPTGSFEEIMDSITNKLMALPEETIVYPGHGKVTMISDERNIYYELKEKEF